jgi:hypothetical protein
MLTSRSEEACRTAAEEISCPHYVSSNVSNREGCERLAEHVATVFDNRLDVLINNAVCFPFLPFFRLDHEMARVTGTDKRLGVEHIVCIFCPRLTSASSLSLSLSLFICLIPHHILQGASWGEPLERKSGKANWGFDKVLDLVCTSMEFGWLSPCLSLYCSSSPNCWSSLMALS